MATAFVQSASFIAAAGTSTTVAVTFTSNVVAGNLIAVGVTVGSAASALSSVTDSLGNTYVIVQGVNDTTNNQSMSTAYAKNILGGANTVTANFSSALDFRGIEVHEISGADTASPLDGNAGQWQTLPGTGTDGVTSGNFTPANNGAYIFGVTVSDAGADETLTAGTGYTIRENVAITNGLKIASEDRIQATAAAIAATFTTSVNQSHITLGMGFKPAAGAAAKTPYQPWYFRAPVMAQ